MDIQFGNLTSLHLLWIVAAVGGLMFAAAVLRRRALKQFATSNLVQRLTARISGPRRLLKAALVIASLVLLSVALTDPRWGQTWREVPQKGIDVMFAVDVSRSMLAEDATPSRLERARQQIGDMLDAMHGDRVGLVAFAGDVKQLSPLTTNYHDFKQTLETIGPHSVPRGGSKLGNALKMAARGFLDQTDDHKAIVVFTDGDDQDSDPVDVAKELYADQGIRVFTVGLGDAEQGARIPVAHLRGGGMQWLEHNGEQVWSKMNGAVLQQVAQAADGAWIPAGTKQVDMAGVYRSYIANIEQRDFETARIHSYIPRYQWFIGLALALLVMESLISDRRRRTASVEDAVSQTNLSGPTSPATSNRRAVTAGRGKLAASALVLGAISLGTASPASAEDASSLVADANKAVTAGEYETAIADYRRAAEMEPGRWEPIYNEAVAQYRAGDLPAARELFTRVLSSGHSELEAQARFNLANCDYAEAVATAEQDRDTAISKLETAVAHYRATLATDKADTDARINIELAGRLIDRLRQEQQEEEQQQDQDQQPEQNDQNQDSSRNDESQQSESEQDQSAENQQSEDQQSKDQKSQDEPSENSRSQDQKGDESSQDQQQSEQEKSQDVQSDESQSEQNPEEQRNAEAKTEKQEASDQQQQQPSADQSPEGQDQSQEAQPQAGGQPQPSDGQASGVPQYGPSTSSEGEARPMTEIEADKMLQAVRDRDLRRRLEQQRAERRRSVPVDKDW